MLLEAGSRKPGAPTDAAIQAAVLQSRLGRQQRAIASLREILLITSDGKARRALLDQLAKISSDDSEELAAELLGARRDFERQWRAARPAVPATIFILLGPPSKPGFDLGELAIGGRELFGSDGFERLPPLDDEPSGQLP